MAKIPTLQEFLNEGKLYSEILEFEQKDVNRIRDFFKKAKGSDEKVLQLARTMAKKIKKVDKAIARAEAAESVLGKDENEVADIFWLRAKDLGADIETNKDKFQRKIKDLQIGSVIKGGKKAGRKPPPPRGPGKGSSILPVGKVNLITGKCKYFNIYDTWQDSTAEVWRVDNKYRLVFTSGDGPIYIIGSKHQFIHDQTMRPLFYGEMVDWAQVKNLKDLIDIYGKSILGYTYK